MAKPIFETVEIRRDTYKTLQELEKILNKSSSDILRRLVTCEMLEHVPSVGDVMFADEPFEPSEIHDGWNLVGPDEWHWCEGLVYCGMVGKEGDLWYWEAILPKDLRVDARPPRGHTRSASDAKAIVNMIRARSI